LEEIVTLRGRSEPRVATPELRPLTPDTSYGFEFIDFMAEIGHPLLPWQKVAAIRGGELLCDPECSPALGVHAPIKVGPDGEFLGGCRPRFRIVLLVVARQNGKTELPVGLSIFWQFRQRLPLIVGTSTKLPYAKESWRKAVNLVKRTPALNGLHEPGRKWYRLTNGETESWTLPNDQGQECRYLIAAANAEGGRSLSINRGIADELRQHRTYEAWEAFEPACSPADTQIWALSNAGDSRSVVLNDLQDSARDFIDTGVGDSRLGLLEWSAPDEADPEDVDALLQANPRVGYGLDLDVLLAGARRAKRLGGQALTGFQTERMCIRVGALNPALNARAWREGCDPGDLLDVRSRVALCLHLTPDADHATLAAAAELDDGRVRVETVAEWSGMRAAAAAEADLPGWVEKIRPRGVGWFPAGPGAAVAARLADRRRKGVRGWPPRGVLVAEIRGEAPAVCMGLAKEIDGGHLAHSGQDMLDRQVERAEKQPQPGGGWVFRQTKGNVDAVYAVAGAVHLARTMPRPRQGTGFHAV
jgi:hypothetical protein